MRMRRVPKLLAWALAVALCLSLPPGASPWGNYETHFEISKNPSDRSVRFAEFLQDTRTVRFRIAVADPEVDAWIKNGLDPRQVEASFKAAGFGAELSLRACVRFGTIHEDSVSPKWRFTSHFFRPNREDPTNDAKGMGLDVGMWQPLVETQGYINKCTDWAAGTIDDPQSQGFDAVDFVDYMKQAWTAPNRTDRRRMLFRALFTAGHLMHLIEDLHQPGHSRNDTHIGTKEAGFAAAFARAALFHPSVMEEWGADHLTPGVFDGNVQARITAKARPMWSPSLKRYFVDSAVTVNTYFLSEDTISFDDPYLGPGENITDWRDLKDEWRHQALARDARKELKRDPVGELEELLPLASARMLPEARTWEETFGDRTHRNLSMYYTLSLEAGRGRDPDRLPREYAKQLIPQSVSRDWGLLDYLFRGRLGVNAVVDPNDPRILVVSVRNASQIGANGAHPSTADVTWQDGTVEFFWETLGGADPPTLVQDGTTINVSKWAPSAGPQATVRLTLPVDGKALRIWYRGKIGDSNSLQSGGATPEVGFAAACADYPGAGVCGGD